MLNHKQQKKKNQNKTQTNKQTLFKLTVDSLKIN